jgi:ABC-2 type transport system ATP-binding protein
MIRVESLRKSYGPLTALADVSLEIAPGTIHGLIGPNGAGKTTLIRIMTGLLEADAGRILIDGEDVTASPDLARHAVGWMPDFFGVYAELTAREYLLFFAEAHGVERSVRERRATELLERVGLAEKRDASIGALSRGMVQRLVFARALVHDPPILVLDEPASGLDPRARIELREILRGLANDGRTVLVSSHILAELEEMVDRVSIIEKGVLLYSGVFRDAAAEHGPVIELKVSEASASVAADFLTGDSVVRGLAREGTDLFRFHLDRIEELDPLLGRLIAAGVGIRRLESGLGIERFFLDRTRGETQ